MIELLLTLFKAIPILLPVVWVCGALVFYRKYEKRKPRSQADFELPPLSILVPCHNEEDNVVRTIRSLESLNYPNYEIIAINDGSRDATLEILNELTRTIENLRVVNLEKNRGKAAALSCGLLASKSPYLLCIDADSELDPQAARWMIRHFLDSTDVAAVTGNPLVKNRGTLIGRLQVGEFSVLVGLIKRYQRIIGKLFTVSGVIVMFRRSALLDVGLWDLETVTEDIGVSWKLQSRGWNLRYEPRATCQVLMPDTLKGLWSQRLRWARGGFETMLVHAKPILGGGQRWRLKLIILEYFMAVFWALATPVLLAAGLCLSGADGQPLLLEWIHPLSWSILTMGLVSLVQFAAGSLIHGRYEKKAAKFGYWAIWYPFIYWLMNSLVLFVAIPQVLFSKKQKFGTWVSPDRGEISFAKTKENI